MPSNAEEVGYVEKVWSAGNVTPSEFRSVR